MLSAKQLRYLRSLGHDLHAIVQIGVAGVNAGVESACSVALSDHELVKVKVGQPRAAERREIASALAQATGAEIAQIIGRTVLLFRPRPAGDDRPRIRLPQ
jgi:RNA-binding protein